jgi:hypothetical protein
MPAPRLTPELIVAAVEGYESQKARIDQKIAELRAMLTGGPPKDAAAPEATTGKRKKLSAAARRRMKEAQQRRWAKIRGESEPSASATPEAPKAKRRISKEGMARIIAATKKRWRLQKAAAKAAAKKAVPARKKVAVEKAAKKTASAPAQAGTEAAGQ